MEGTVKLERWEEEPDELDVEMSPREDPYRKNVPITEDRQTEGDFSDLEDVELPRGAAGQMFGGDALAEHNDDLLLEAIHKPISHKVDDEDPTVKKTRIFVESIKKDAAWARSLDSVKITVQTNPFFTKETMRDFILYLLTRVNNRPRFLVITSKQVTLDDMREMIEAVFTPLEQPEVAIENSTTRVYTKNTSPSLKKLAKCIADTCGRLPGVEVEYHDIFAELLQKGRNRRRMKTLDLKSYFMYEEHARALGFRVLASFTLSQIGSPGRMLNIRWYDELAKDGKTRVSYIHFDHCVRAASKPSVTFSNAPPIVHEVLVDDDAKMIPTALASSEKVTDFIEFLAQTATGTHSL